MIATLPMYLRPQLVDAYDRYWALIRDNLHARNIDAPQSLSHQYDTQEIESTWENPQLVLGQTCGLPHNRYLKNKVQIVATADYGLADNPAGYYHSLVVTHKSKAEEPLQSFESSVFAYNSADSQSGFAAAYWYFKPLGIWFDRKFHSGSHRASAVAVSAGEADIAVIDAVTWSLLERFEDCTQDLQIRARTKSTPGIPYICAPDIDAVEVKNAITQALDSLETPDRELLGIKQLADIPAQTYLLEPDPPSAKS